MLATWSICGLTERNVLGFPWVANPDITGCNGGMIPAGVDHLLGQLSFLRLVLVLQYGQYRSRKKKGGQKLTCKTNIEKVVFSPSRPKLFCASSTSFSNSRTAYSRVVRVSSTSSTIRTFLPIKLAISNELKSSHCVRVTLVPGTSSGSSRPRFS